MNIKLGPNDLRVGMSIISQYVGPSVSAGVWQTGPDFRDLLHFGSHAAHVLIQADVIIRPTLVKTTDDLRGRGVSSLFTEGWLDPAWVRAPVLFKRPH